MCVHLLKQVVMELFYLILNITWSAIHISKKFNQSIIILTSGYFNWKLYSLCSVQFVEKSVLICYEITIIIITFLII